MRGLSEDVIPWADEVPPHRNLRWVDAVDEPASTVTNLSRRTAFLGGLGASVATLVLMVATEPGLTIVWDEAYTLARVDRVRTWIGAMREVSSLSNRREYFPLQDTLKQPDFSRVRSRGDLLSREILYWSWPFAREEPHGHPPFYAEVALIGDLITPGWPLLFRARLGTILVHSLAAGILFAFLSRRRGLWAALTTASAWSLQPHLFAMAHYATYDALLTSLWVFVVLAFFLAMEEPKASRKWLRWVWVLVFGLVLGMAMGTKLTGWLIPAPLLVWCAVFRSRFGVLAVVVGGILGLMTVVALTPPFWIDPFFGLYRFFESNLTRAQTIPIRTMFLGTVYETPIDSLPWYNTLVLTAFVTPVGFLLLAITGAGRVLRRFKTDLFGVLVLLNWGFLLVLRALPHAPGHDGVRQFLPAFGLLAVSAGLGAGWLASRNWGRAFVGISIVEAVVSVAVMMPVPLSYYSPLAGGLPGATALGMEPTFYWDGLTDEALRKLDALTPPGENVLFAGYPIVWYNQQTGRLKAGICAVRWSRIHLDRGSEPARFDE